MAALKFERIMDLINSYGGTEKVHMIEYITKRTSGIGVYKKKWSDKLNREMDFCICMITRPQMKKLKDLGIPFETIVID